MRLGTAAILVAILGTLMSYTPCRAEGIDTGDSDTAVLDGRQPWHGGIIGRAPGTIVGATVEDLSYRALREASIANSPVEYRTENGRIVYRAEPMGFDMATKCRTAREQIWKDGKLVRDKTREVCEGGRPFEKRY